MVRNRLLYEYEQILMGNRNSFSRSFFPKNQPSEREKNALAVFKYAIEMFLGWSPYVAKEKLKKPIIRDMRLSKVLTYIDFPVELEPDKDLDYVLSLLYPKQILITKEERILRYYVRLLEQKDRYFVRGYFSESDAREKACICLRYILTNHSKSKSIEQLYNMFSSTRGRGSKDEGSDIENSGKEYLKQYKLDHIASDLYENKLDFLHDALPDSQKNNFLYLYYKFKERKTSVHSAFKQLPIVITTSLDEDSEDVEGACVPELFNVV